MWWLYLFTLAALLQALALALLIFESSVLSYFSYAFSLLSLVPLTGYVLQRPFGYRVLWVAFTPVVFAAYAITAVVFLGTFSLAELQDAWKMLLAVGLFAAPGAWAMVAYAFRSPHIWQRVQA